MNSAQHFSRFTWFLIGLATGIAGMFFYQIGERARYAAEYSDASQDYYLHRRALDAYQTENTQAAIFALTEYLANVERLKGRRYSSFEIQVSESGMFPVHAMLARLYAESGETNLSAQHLDMALQIVRQIGKIPSVTNQATVFGYLDHQYGRTSQ